ncbi:MAG TPA: CGNR zinc finger domain-containing protein [Trebonia sp.]
MDIGGGQELAIEFVNTLAHDGHGGVADLLDSADSAAAWLAEHGVSSDGASPGVIESVRRVRLAARSVFASAVAPLPASRADDGRPRMPVDEALTVLQDAVDALAPRTAYRLGDAGITAVRTSDASSDVVAAGILGLSVLEFLAGPAAVDLRACQAPRCVRYFVKRHGRQEWCKESCANRARVARHAERQRLAHESGASLPSTGK